MQNSLRPQVSTLYNGSIDLNKVVYNLETNRAQFFTTLTVKVYPNRISLGYRPFFGGGENRETYSAMDIGYVYIKKI